MTASTDPRPNPPARNRIEELLAQKGGHRSRGGAQPGATTGGENARRTGAGSTRERPAAPARTFRRKV